MNHYPHLCSACSGNHNSACIPNNNLTQGRRLFGFTVAIVSILVFVSVEPGVLYTIPKTNGIIRGHRDTVETQLIFFFCLSVEIWVPCLFCYSCWMHPSLIIPWRCFCMYVCLSQGKHCPCVCNPNRQENLVCILYSRLNGSTENAVLPRDTC